MCKNDITGQKFGYWTVLGRDESYHDNKRSKWICQCKCGAIRSVFKQSLLNGRSKSCGCRPSENRKGINSTHGMSGTRIHHIWMSMRRRCDCKSGKYGIGYADRGITVCDEWRNSFETFYEWAMSNGYTDELTIDRIDNDKGYSPENCRWITIGEQQANKRNTIFIDYNGEKRCLRTVCTELGLPYKVIHRRYKRMKSKGEGIDAERLLRPSDPKYKPFRYREEAE